MSNRSDGMPIISCSSLYKTFNEGKLFVEVLHGIDFEICEGQMVAIVGPSGSGKSTLLQLLGGLDRATSGSVKIQGIDIFSLSENAKGLIRNKYLGFIYQFHHLLPEFDALENVAIPLLIGGASAKNAEIKAKEMLTLVGLSARFYHRIAELSGGERQRVAIARALVTSPKCVLADEPTGNLDHQTAQQIYELIYSLNQQSHTAFIIVTHDLSIAKRMQRTMILNDGVLRTSNG